MTTQLTNEQVNEVLAGFEYPDWTILHHKEPLFVAIEQFRNGKPYRKDIRNYTESLDACRRVLEKLQDIQEDYVENEPYKYDNPRFLMDQIEARLNRIAHDWDYNVIPKAQTLAHALAEVVLERGLR